jgi:hypothetical protein
VARANQGRSHDTIILDATSHTQTLTHTHTHTHACAYPPGHPKKESVQPSTNPAAYDCLISLSLSPALEGACVRAAQSRFGWGFALFFKRQYPRYVQGETRWSVVTISPSDLKGYACMAEQLHNLLNTVHYDMHTGCLPWVDHEDGLSLWGVG